MRAHAVQGLKSRALVGEKGKDVIDNYMLFRIEKNIVAIELINFNGNIFYLLGARSSL